jgi:hypothetical protein
MLSRPLFTYITIHFKFAERYLPLMNKTKRVAWHKQLKHAKKRREKRLQESRANQANQANKAPTTPIAPVRR